METFPDRVSWGTEEIPYRYCFAQRKTLGISVHPDTSVTVKAPLGSSLETIQQFVLKRAGWISRSRRDFEQYLPTQPPRRYISGESHRYLGRQYRLKVEQGDVRSVKCLRGYLWVTSTTEPTPGQTEELLESWYRDHAQVIFSERLKVCHRRTVQEGIPFPDLIIRKMSNRWGSFSAAGRITLNLELIKAPKECIDYVILHELCHFRVKHHGPTFWKLMERLLPDYDERRTKLNLLAG
jgi:predicted metal-dependent hydrolase